MKIKTLAIGDIVGSPGRKAMDRHLSAYIERESIDFVVANAENAAGGSGLTPKIVEELISYGVDVVTSGDHMWRKREMVHGINGLNRVIRPENFPTESPGKGHTVVEAKNGLPVAVLSLLGRVFMPPADCPFKAADAVLAKLQTHTKVILVDMHCEATSEKVAMGWHLDGRASLVFGTHTHIQTADERVLPNGTGYITDVGMTGPYDSVIGRDKDKVLKKMITNLPERFDVATDDVRICGAMTTVDVETGKALHIQRVVIRDTP